MRDYTIVQPIHQETSRSELSVRDGCSPKANCQRDTSIPSAASAAIILYFVLQEAGCTKVSPRLLFGRVVDFGNGREGPTMEDYYSMTNYRTPLPGDEHPDTGTVCNPRISNPTRITHDPQFFNLRQSGSNAYCSLPDVITGLWEGVYMVCSEIQLRLQHGRLLNCNSGLLRSYEQRSVVFTQHTGFHLQKIHAMFTCVVLSFRDIRQRAPYPRVYWRRSRPMDRESKGLFDRDGE